MKKVILTILIAFALSFLFSAATAQAQAGYQAEVGKQLGAAAGEKGAAFGQARDPRLVAAYIVQIMLSLIGTIFLIYLIYAGVLFMTSGGDEEKVTKAKKIIRFSIIGVLVAISAYSITLLVARILTAKYIEDGTYFYIEEPTTQFYTQDPLYQSTVPFKPSW